MTLSFLSRTPLALAHRGFSLDGLENTMTAFRAAWDLGFTHLETDVHATRDGVLVVFHDAELDRMGGASGRIADMSWAELSAVRVGGSERVPRFEELAEGLPSAYLNVDVKAAGAVGPLTAAIERLGLHDRVLVASFSDRRRRAVIAGLSRPVASSAGRNGAAAAVLLGKLSGTSPTGTWRRLLRDVDCFQLPERQGRFTLVDAAFVARAHRWGKQVHVWTVNEEDAMERLLDLGVDGIVTDRADRLRAVLERRGEWRE